MGHEKLRERIGAARLEKRLQKQKDHSTFKYRDGVKLYWENFEVMASTLNALLKLTGQMRRGLVNAWNIRVRNHTISSASLPEAFDGFTILQISDLHIDGMPDHGRHLIDLIAPLKYDLCVLTGDFRYLTYGPWEECVTLSRHVVQSIPDGIPVMGILGNHDFIEMLPELEKAGVTMLCNESRRITRDGSSIGLTGTDDVHFYETGDLKIPFRQIEDCAFKIALVHSQELIFDAATLGFDLYLCGHTHGGQICLPGSIPILHNTPRPFRRHFFRGPWQLDKMRGYTSYGAGSSGLPVRFFCPPEIVLHTLRRT